MNSRFQVIDSINYKWMKEDENVGVLSPLLLLSPLPSSPPPTPAVSPSTPSIGITLEEFARLMQIQLLNEPSFIEKSNDSENDSQLGIDAQGMKREPNKYHAEEEREIEDSQNSNTGSSLNRLFSLSPPQIVVYSEDLEIVERSITSMINKEKNKESKVKKSQERDVEKIQIGLEEESDYSKEEMDDETPSSIHLESPNIFCNEKHDFFEEIWYPSAIEENLRRLQSEQGVFPPFISPNYNFPSLPDISPPSPYNRSFISYAPVPQFVADQIKARPQSSPIPFERFDEEKVETPFHIADIMCHFIKTETDCVNDEYEKKQKKDPEKRKSKMSKTTSAPNISNNKNQESESPHLLCKRIRLDPTEQPPNNLTFWNMDSSSSLLADMFDCAIPPTESFSPSIPNYTHYIKPFQK